VLLKAFGQQLKAIRAPKFEAQEDLAAATRLHRTHIGFLEQGRREPSLSTLLIPSETLKVPVQELVEGLPSPKQRRPERKKKRKAC
jgi:transcriptional regulator with XRE-family HTH domain